VKANATVTIEGFAEMSAVKKLLAWKTSLVNVCDVLFDCDVLVYLLKLIYCSHWYNSISDLFPERKLYIAENIKIVFPVCVPMMTAILYSEQHNIAQHLIVHRGSFHALINKTELVSTAI